MNKPAIFAPYTLCSLMFGLVILPGCSNLPALGGQKKGPPTIGDKMMEHSDAAEKLSEQWGRGKEKTQEGAKLIEQGNEMIKEARIEIRRGEMKIVEGQKMIEDGKQQMKENEKVYEKTLSDHLQHITSDTPIEPQ
ncbi:MAG: hypothetical protein WC762_05365 [Methylobacter sp.]|jgi:hypothetical protein